MVKDIQGREKLELRLMKIRPRGKRLKSNKDLKDHMISFIPDSIYSTFFEPALFCLSSQE